MKVLNKRLHYFNPGHETTIQSGMIHYTPTASVRKMMADLALLPLWFGQNDDYILTDGSIDPSAFLAAIPDTLRPTLNPVTPAVLRSSIFREPVEAAPWGLSPQSIHLFQSLQTADNRLIVPPWKEAYTQLTARQTAADCLKMLQIKKPEFRRIVLPHFCTDTSEVNQYIASYPPPYVLKMPYSCSGRGLYWITDNYINKLAAQWIKGAIRKQGSVSIESALNKVCDFALEFECDGKGDVQYKGLSVFTTLGKGAFNGNLLGTQQVLEKQLTTYISEEQLITIRDEIKLILSEHVGFVYKGYLGVDMLIYQDHLTFAVHPFIELNLRYTMGLVALQLSQRLIHSATSGQFIVSHDKNAAVLHQQMQQKHPLQIKEGKIHSGYFPLCPVCPETNYRAYILA